MVEKKCKMCGGDLVLVEGRTIYECEYCGAKQIIPLSKEETEAEEKARALEEEKKRLERQKAEEEKHRLENEKLEAEQKRIEEEKRAEEEKKRIDEQKAEEARLRLEEEREKARLEEKKRRIEQERLEEEKRRIEEQKREEERRRQKAESIGEEVTPEKKNKKMLLKIVLILFALCVVGAICAIAIDAQEKTKIAEKQRIEAEKKAKIEEQKRIEAEEQAKIEEEKRVKLALKKEHQLKEAEAKVRAAQADAEAKLKAAKKAQTGGGTKISSLYWSKRSRDKMNWNAAVKYCQNLNEGGYSDWRLPTISELRTTIKNCSDSQSGGSCRVSDNCLGSNCWSYDCRCEYRENNGGYYSKLGDDDKVWLWSSSVLSDGPSYRWYVDFVSGYVGYIYYVDFNLYVRCVR